MLRLGSLILNTPVLQSPMAGCTDIAFRLTARACGLELAFTEMVSAEAMVRNNRKTSLLLRRVRGDAPLGIQLVGHCPVAMGRAAALAEAMKFQIIDLNFGCPVRKVTSLGAGSALLRKPDIARTMFQNVMRNVKKTPVTVKMRCGFEDPSGQEALRIATMAEDLGLAAVTIHGRTRLQGYTGKADWSVIRLVKKNLGIPVLGNGDIFAAEDALRMMEITGCDGVSIGRGALGNPWIYKNIHRLLAGEPPVSPGLTTKKRIALMHVRLEVKHEGERIGVLQSRKIIGWYFKGCPNAAALRERINRATTFQEMRELIGDFKGENEAPS
ncbi:MAG: tRNA dihydrouridine synthase DusB [Candidatus Omnitrophica bacterium]|nr:tRNA dihydrouridine synthase DusB [Candidatus Omnitrophota bacterium]